MELSNSYKLILGVVPFASIVIGGWLCKAIPDSSIIAKLLSVIAEKDLTDLMRKNGFSKTSVITFQLVRIVVAILGSYGITIVLGEGSKSGIALFVLLLILMYKVFYIWLLSKDRGRIKRLNIVLPYTIKSIAYLASVYPVNNALIKAIDISPVEFKPDLEKLCSDIDEDPTSFAPYQAFIDKYDGRLNRLDYYLKTLYRMSMSASTEEAKLLSNLNETISEEMSTARKAKNDAVNSTVTWLGLIPVALLSGMLLFLMLAVSTAI